MFSVVMLLIIDIIFWNFWGWLLNIVWYIVVVKVFIMKIS